MQLLANGKQQFIDANGAPLASGKVYFYAPGTLTPATTYQDAAGTIPNANPVNLDSAGQAGIWGAGTYRQIVKDVFGSQIWDQTVSTPDLSAPLASFAGAAGAALVGFQNAGAGSVARTVQDKARDIISVKDFGAKGDGITDDTAAIQAAINYAASLTNAGSVYIPTGTYNIAGSLVMPIKAYMTVFGDGYGSRLVKSGSGDLLKWVSVSTGSSIVSYATIRNLAFDGGTGSGHLINMQYASSATLRDIFIYNIPANKAGVFVTGTDASTYCHDNSIDGITIRSSTGDSGIAFDGTASDSRVSNAWIEGLFGLNYCMNFAAGAAQIQVSDSHIYNAAINVVSILNNAGHITFSNCIIDNATNNTVYVKNARGVSFIGGKIMFAKGAYADVILDNSQNVRLIGVDFEGNNGAYALREVNGGNDNSILNCSVRGGYTASPPFSILGDRTTIKGVNGYNPLGYVSAFNGASIGPIATGTTTFLGSNAQQPVEDDTLFVVPMDGTVRSFVAQVNNPPGAGQSFTYTLRKNFADTSSNYQLSGAGAFTATSTTPVSVAKGDIICLKLVTSGSATTARHRFTINLEY